jgi:hypothetical protein
MSKDPAKVLQSLSFGRSNQPQIVEGRQRARAQTSFFSTSAYDYTRRALHTGQFDGDSSSSSDDDDDNSASSSDDSSERAAASSGPFQTSGGRRRTLSAKAADGDYVDDRALALMLGEKPLKPSKAGSRRSVARKPAKSQQQQQQRRGSKRSAESTTTRGDKRARSSSPAARRNSKPASSSSSSTARKASARRNKSEPKVKLPSTPRPRFATRETKRASPAARAINPAFIASLQSPAANGAPTKRAAREAAERRAEHYRESDALLDELIVANRPPLTGTSASRLVSMRQILRFLCHRAPRCCHSFPLHPTTDTIITATS